MRAPGFIAVLGVAAGLVSGPARGAEPEGDYALVRMLEAEIVEALRHRREILERIRTEGGGSRAGESLEAEAVPLPVGPLEFQRATTRPALPPDPPDEAFEHGVVRGPWPWSEQETLVEWKLDADRDGRPEEILYFKPYVGTLLHRNRDRDLDGRMDSWLSYQAGDLVRRDLDESGDGRWDQREHYAEGALVRRDVDRDLDGVVDARLLYRDGWLAEQLFDPNNDDVVDVRVIYDRDGIRERHHDVDGDGRVDVISFYEGGKLRRRELARPDVEDLPGAASILP